ncbi:MAG: biopolymer transporter ExbD [Pseudomonadota bacterium]
MALKHRAPRKRASITSLIDVIFLLLLFFMLSSTFSRFSEIEISVASSSGNSSASSDNNLLLIEATGVSLGAEQLQDVDIVVRLQALAAAGTTSLTVEPADAVVTQRMIDVLTIVAEVPGLDVTLREPEF